MSLPANTYSVQRRMLIAGLGAIGALVVVSITCSFMLLKARQDKRAPKNSPEVSKATVAPRRIRHEEERDERGWTPVHMAAHRGDVPSLSRLLGDGYSATTVNNVGSTPLHYAAYGGHVGAVTVLLDAGADINAQNNSGITPLTLAIEQMHRQVEVLMRERGATQLVDDCD